MIFVLVLAISLAVFSTGLGLRGLVPGIEYGTVTAAVVALSSLAGLVATQFLPTPRKRRPQPEP